VEEAEKEDDAFHLDDDVTKDYSKGKDWRLMLEDRYERRRKKKEERMRRKLNVWCLSMFPTIRPMTESG
jgi:hypothetical protein